MGYQGPFPRLPENPFLSNPEFGKQNRVGTQRLSRDQHPGWDTECLLKQEQLHGGLDMVMHGSSSDSSSIDGDKQLRNNGDGSRKRRALNTTSPTAVNSTGMLCNGRADLCDLRYNQVIAYLTGCIGFVVRLRQYVRAPNSSVLGGKKFAQTAWKSVHLGTCFNNNSQVVMCHGYGAQRATGDTLDSVLTQIVTFMEANPYEVLTVEFNEYDADTTLMSQALVQKIIQYFTLPSGQMMLWPRSSLNEPWPTLRNMILANQRIMIFMSGTYWAIPSPVPAWANQKDTWKLDGFDYTSNDTQPGQLNQSYYAWCDQGPPTDGSFVLWQQIDINLAILESDIVSSLKQGQIPELCIGPLAIQTNSALLDALADYCYTRWPYWFRVRVNDYWQGDLFKVVNHFNDMNVARVKAGDTITPY
ncbi:hypothetical protein BGX26_010575 [Mortierella sp. AD094]|nr:hypothetical protein BGX26_010575 [Mortierella sp. AD094]